MIKQGRLSAIIFCWIAIVLFAIFPSVAENVDLYWYTKITILGILLILSLLTSISKAVNENAFFRTFLIVIIIFGVLLLTAYAINCNVGWSDLAALIIVLWVMMIGYQTNLDKNSLSFLVLIYGVLSIVLGFLSLVYYTGTVSLSSYEYAVETKNQIGQVVATGGIGLLILLSATSKHKVFVVALVLLSIIVLSVLRCRTALLAYLLFLAVYIQKTVQSKYKIVIFYLIVFAFLFFFSRLYDLFETLFVGSHDINDMDSLSTNRMERNIQGIAFIISHPFWGELKTFSGIENIHNYVIKRLVLYGLFCVPVLYLYFLFLFRHVKSVILKSVELNHVGLFMLIVPFFASLLEPSAPFGPGLVQVIPFFFFGIFLKSTKS